MSSASAAPVRFGLIGLGRAGTFQLEQLCLRDDCRASVVHDVDPARESVAAQFGCRFEHDGAELVDAEDVDVVVVATPPASHAHWAMAALTAGKHVLVEAPLCLSAADAELLADAARQAGRHLWVVPGRRAERDFRAARQAVRSGGLGELQGVKFVLWSYGVTPLRPAAERAWHVSAAPGGGALVRFAAPHFAQLLELVDDEPASVFGQFLTDAGRGEAGGPEAGVLAVVRFARGTLAHIELNLASLAPLETGWLVSGTRGAYYGERLATMLASGELLETPLDVPAEDRGALYETIVRQVRSDTPPPALARQARREALLLEAVRLSAVTGRTVDWQELSAASGLAVGAQR